MAANTVVLTFAGDSKRLESAFDRVGKAARDMSADVGGSAGAFDRVGQAADRAGERSATGFVGRLRSGLGGLSEVVGGGFAALPPQVKGAVGAAAAAVGLIFAGGLGGAVLLGLGGGVLALGIKQAMQDPAVAAAWKTFGDRAKTALSGFGDAFKGPVTRAAGTFGDAIERMSPAFTRIGQTMAPIIDKLAPALADMAERAMPGIEKAVKASGPLFEKLAEHLPAIGDAVSSFFDSVSESGPGALVFIDLVLSAFTGLIRFWGNGIEFWAKTLEALNVFFTDKVPRAWGWLVDKFKSGIDWLAGVPGKLRDVFGKVADFISAPFRSAFNAVARAWNNTVGRLSWTVPGWVPGIGGNTIGAPNLPTFHSGGTVPGRPGETVIAAVLAGEQIRSRSASGGGGTVVVQVEASDRRVGELLLALLRPPIQAKGGNVQFVLGPQRA